MLTLPLPPRFDLPRAVCSYGYFMLAPNRWDASNQVLETVLRDAQGNAVPVHIAQRDKLHIKTNASVSSADAAVLRHQVARMLRLNEDFSAFHRVHPKARRARFGCLFRSATLFEDIIKTMTGCNVTWPNTIRMNALLCRHIGAGGFPTPDQLARIKPDVLKAKCKVGYRAERIIRLAQEVSEGKRDLAQLERPDITTEQLFESLRTIHGIGPYAAGNLCQLLGKYDRLAIDSETYRHFRQVHGMPTPKTHRGLRRLHAKIEKFYAPFAPYQFIAYWFELWGDYETRFGDSKKWDHEVAPSFTAAKLKK